MNEVSLIGRLTRDVDLKTTGNGTSVATFNLAVKRKFKKANGEYESDFINCVIWRKAAEIFAQYTQKGSQVGINGTVQTRNYEDNDGKRVYVTEIVVSDFDFLDSKQDNQQSNNNYQSQTNNVGSDPFVGMGTSVDIDESQLPF